jgi:hypothetical protein
MFIGHFGVAMAAKRLAPKTSLGILIFAANFLDLLWPILLLLGIEHVRIAPGITRMTPLDFTDYPISHSLIMVLLWAVFVGCAYYTVRRYGRGAWVVGCAVFSHWGLDFIVHRPDLPLWLRGDTRMGLGLWNSPIGTVVAETLCFGLGLCLAWGAMLLWLLVPWAWWVDRHREIAAIPH